MKKDKILEKAYENLGFRFSDVNSKSELLLAIDNTKAMLTKIEDMFCLLQNEKDDNIKNLARLEDLENEYELEVLRKLNPRLTIK